MGWISLDDIDQDNIKYVPVVTDPVVGIPLSEPPTENVVNAKAGGEDLWPFYNYIFSPQ